MGTALLPLRIPRVPKAKMVCQRPARLVSRNVKVDNSESRASSGDLHLQARVPVARSPYIIPPSSLSINLLLPKRRVTHRRYLLDCEYLFVVLNICFLMFIPCGACDITRKNTTNGKMKHAVNAFKAAQTGAVKRTLTLRQSLGQCRAMTRNGCQVVTGRTLRPLIRS
ncbi:hypothetical protein EVAR_32299_1 [Eumeta japonica]|uniref:Uncharacterized protein n=1 Tax=Eumeta variegata TaxID=151549 RepID=A0A4C1WD44_EUMVA|nr:hypothetical protein EVAR_32299_1 [Eumeta japonica]